jgi:DNA-binding MarR family transcriptional regulator
MSNKTDQRFAPVPARVARDPRLRARHFRALIIIALHDQLDKNGAGCWASQRRLAALAGVHETGLSHTLTELRDYGYLVSKIHATNRRRRIHRLVYNDRDKNWDRDTCSTQQDARPDSCAPEQVSEGRYLQKTAPILAENGGKFDASENDSKDLALGTYVPLREHISNPAESNRTDCAEARNRSAVTEAEKYLTDIEALAASSDRDNLKFERARIAQLADDACLPDELNERATRLLSQISNRE